MHVAKKILVTGGTGFLGAYILKALIAEGYTVSALKRSTGKLPGYIDATILRQVHWIEGDILDIPSLEAAMQGVDTVIHSAAIVSFSKNDRSRMYTINIEGTANVVNTALEQGVRRLVYISSVAALGRKKDGATVDEETRWEDSNNNTHYAITKFKAELEAWRGFAEGLEGIVLNPATILGYGNWEDGSCALFKNIYKEFGWYSNGVNGFTLVEDVAHAAVLAAGSDITEERYIVCNENLSFRDLFNNIADSFGKKRPTREATPQLSGIAWRLEKIKSFFTGKKSLITKESAKVANSHTRFNGEKIAQQLPGFVYSDLKVGIENACKKYIAAI